MFSDIQEWSRMLWVRRFPKDLEDCYQEQRAASVKRGAYLGLGLALACILVLAALDLRLVKEDAASRSHLQLSLVALRGVNLIPIGAMLVSLGSPRSRSLLRPLAAAVLLCLFLTSALAMALLTRNQLPVDSSELLLILLGAFLPVGLMWRESVAVALVCCASLIPIAFALLGGSYRVQFALLVLPGLLASALGAVSSYLRERSLREQFLLQRRLEHLAGHDPLTGLANRRLFDKHVALCIAQAHREGEELAFVMIDIDHFKHYNDALGHAAGDAALKAVASALGCLARRPMDMAARLGGEEMGLLLFALSPAHMGQLSSELLGLIANLDLAHPSSGTAKHLTVSAGVAWLRPNETANDLYMRADAALYLAKSGGRNQVRCHESAGV